MAGGHPRDEYGRVLPHAWWPADRQAPGELEFVRRFCNSINRENGADRFTTAGGLDHWLASEAAPAVSATSSEMSRVRAMREALHTLVVANAVSIGDDEAWDELAIVARPVSLGVRRGADGLELAPSGSPVEQLVGRLVAAVISAQGDGTWGRLKACRHCHWVVFDPSKNRSSRWCSMSACGGRHNAREYRRRTRSAN